MSKTVWGAMGAGMGDLWSAINFCLRRSQADGQEVLLSTCHGAEHRTAERLAEMLEQLDAPGARVRFVDEERTDDGYMGGECWHVKYFPTKVRWSAASSAEIAYQFDGKSSAEMKNPPQSDKALFLDWCDEKSLFPRRVGRPLPIAQVVETLARCRLFIGPCSGVSHICHSVGIPVYLLQYQHDVAWWHGEHPITICAGMADFISKAS